MGDNDGMTGDPRLDDLKRLERDFATAMEQLYACLLYTSDAADERSSVDLGGRRIIKKKNKVKQQDRGMEYTNNTTNRQCAPVTHA